MKISSLTGLILASTLTVLAGSQLAAFASPKTAPTTESTYVGRGKKQISIETVPQRRDKNPDRNNNPQECRIASIKVSTTPAVYRAPDGHIFKMRQPVKEEVVNGTPWKACPSK